EQETPGFHDHLLFLKRSGAGRGGGQDPAYGRLYGRYTSWAVSAGFGFASAGTNGTLPPFAVAWQILTCDLVTTGCNMYDRRLYPPRSSNTLHIGSVVVSRSTNQFPRPACS